MDEDVEEETEEEGNNGEWLGMNGVNNEGDAQGEQWDLKEVITKDVILSPDAPQCDTDGCGLVACCIWREKSGMSHHMCILSHTCYDMYLTYLIPHVHISYRSKQPMEKLLGLSREGL